MSTLAPPPAGGGNTKYVAVIAVLFLGLGGLVFWKMNQKTEAPPPLVVQADAAPAQSAISQREDDDVPPPAPIPDAAPPPHVGGGGGGGGGFCNVTKCNGHATSDLESALAFRAKQAHRCYDAALAQDTTLKGKVSISVRVASNGQVCSAGVASNEMATGTVAQCVARMFQNSGHFPAPQGGCIDVAVPISFVPGSR
jgi:hypothetical protein